MSCRGWQHIEDACTYLATRATYLRFWGWCLRTLRNPSYSWKGWSCVMIQTCFLPVGIRSQPCILKERSLLECAGTTWDSQVIPKWYRIKCICCLTLCQLLFHPKGEAQDLWRCNRRGNVGQNVSMNSSFWRVLGFFHVNELSCNHWVTEFSLPFWMMEVRLDITILQDALTKSFVINFATNTDLNRNLWVAETWTQLIRSAKTRKNSALSQ